MRMATSGKINLYRLAEEACKVHLTFHVFKIVPSGIKSEKDIIYWKLILIENEQWLSSQQKFFFCFTLDNHMIRNLYEFYRIKTVF